MAENSGIKFLQYYGQKLKTFFFSKDILSFLLFLALSAAFWFVNALGKERETLISVPIQYVGVPPNIAFTNKPPTEIILNIKDQGLRLFSYSNKHKSPLRIDLSGVFHPNGKILITPDQLSAKIGRYVLPTTSVLEIHPDSILIRYEKLGTKILPIEFVSNIELAHQYMLSEKVKLEPQTVRVYAPRKMLDSLQSIRTEKIELKNLNTTNSFRCKLKPIESVRFSSTDTKVSLFVEPFTEKKIQLPVTFVNSPDHFSIRAFPAVVNVTYNVGLSHFNSDIKKNGIQVYLDYNELKFGKFSKQKLRITNNLSYISTIRIVPQEVEFILEEK